MPWRIEDGMKRIGANYVQAGLWRGFAARDSNLVTGHRTSPPPRRPPNSLRRLVNDVHQPVASDAFRSTASRVNRRPGGWRRLIARDQDASSPSLPDPLLRRWTNAPLRCDRTPFGAPCWPTPPTRRMPILPIGHRSKSSAKGRRTELSAEGRFGTKCGCCLVALTTAIK